MAWAEARAKQAIDRAPTDIRISMQSGTYSTYQPAKQFLRNLGMNQLRHFLTMAIELDSPPPVAQLPEGLRIRTMKGEEEARDVVWAFEDAFKDHWGYVEQPFEKELENWLHLIRNDEEFDPTLWFLAMDGDEIAGISICKLRSDEDPEMGWVRILGVRRAWRRQGLALALLHHSFGELYRRGKKRAGLGVDASSLTGATRLYEKAGMEQIRQFTVFEKILRPGRDISITSVE
jgi:mycothiol synthase